MTSPQGIDFHMQVTCCHAPIPHSSLVFLFFVLMLNGHQAFSSPISIVQTFSSQLMLDVSVRYWCCSLKYINTFYSSGRLDYYLETAVIPAGGVSDKDCNFPFCSSKRNEQSLFFQANKLQFLQSFKDSCPFFLTSHFHLPYLQKWGSWSQAQYSS